LLLLRSWRILAAVWPGMLVGTCIVMAGILVGWIAGAYRLSFGVRFVEWWVTRVILPLLRTRSWSCRATTIFVNNGAISALVVALGAGAMGGAGWAGSPAGHIFQPGSFIVTFCQFSGEFIIVCFAAWLVFLLDDALAENSGIVLDAMHSAAHKTGTAYAWLADIGG